MKSKWFLTFFAIAPFAATVLVLQSCGGEGGPIGGGDGGGGLPPISQQFLALLPAGQAGAAFVGSEKCGECHGTRDSHDTHYNDWLETKHAKVEVGCERCHGPGSNHATTPALDNILTLPKSASAVVCAQCHGSIYDEWRLSQHSKLVASPVEEAAHDPNRYGRTFQCINCHSGVFRAVADNGHAVQDMSDEEIRHLAEGTINDVPHSAPCVSCHNPHKNTGYLSDNGKEVQLRRAVFNTDTGPIGPGTTPTVFTNFDHVCAQCHNGRGTNPSDAALRTGTARPSMHDSNQFNMLMGIGGVEGEGVVARNTAHATAPGQCSTCHMPDSRHSFVPGYDRGCQPCHTATDAAARTNQTKSQVLQRLYALRARLNAWAQATYGDELFWEYTTNITAEGKTPPNQADVPMEIKRARHNYYFVVRDGGYGVHNAPYANHLITVANENLDALSAGTVRVTGVSLSQMEAAIQRDRQRVRRASADGHGDGW